MKKTNIKQTNVQNGITFEEALTQMIRTEPEVTFIGEIRDQKEMESTVMAAQTGKMVITTINSPSPEKIVVDEIREESEMTNAFMKSLNTGHRGSLTTVSANEASSVIERLRNQKQGTALEKINDLRKSREDRLKNLSGRKSKRA